MLRYDASGKLIDQPQLPRQNLPDIVVGETGPHTLRSSATNSASQMSDGSTAVVLANPEESMSIALGNNELVKVQPTAELAEILNKKYLFF